MWDKLNLVMVPKNWSGFNIYQDDCKYVYVWISMISAVSDSCIGQSASVHW